MNEQHAYCKLKWIFFFFHEQLSLFLRHADAVTVSYKQGHEKNKTILIFAHLKRLFCRHVNYMEGNCNNNNECDIRTSCCQ